MTQVQRYLAEEVAFDHADGLITRREALRRLALLGLSLTTASTLLAACAGDEEASGVRTTAPPATRAPSPTPTALPTQAIRFPGPQGRTLQGAWAAAATARGAVLVIHENRGLTDHIRSVAGRLAASGYSALAIDLLSEEGGTSSFADEGEAMAALSRVPERRFDADMRAGVTELGRRARGKKLGAIGFCFGGGMVWRLLDTGDRRLAAAAPFYGPLPEGADFEGSRAAVLAIYAGEDARVNGTRDAARTALERQNLVHEIVTYPGVNHAFFNDTGDRYNAAAAAQAYRRVLAWFGSHLG